MRQKRENHEKQKKDFEAQRKEIARLTEIVNRFRYKPTKASMALSKLKQIERMKVVDEPDPFDLRAFHAAFQPKEESVKNVLRASSLSVGYAKTLATVSFELLKGQKLGVIGPNGAGKSTFVKTIAGLIPPLGGEFSFGVRVSAGYFDQQMARYTSDKTVFSDFSNEFPELTDTEVRSSLGAFLISGDDVFKPVSVLSGGERVRLALCKILKRRPNLLILDEPTNHMDIVGKETLENMLREYEGTLVFVSHDRYFINRVADRLLVFGENGAVFYPFGFDEYEQARKRAGTSPEKASRTEDGEDEKPQKAVYISPLKMRTRKEHRAKKLEELIGAKEAELAALNQEMEKPVVYSDYIRVEEIKARLDGLDEELLEYMTEWEAIQAELAE